MTWHAGRRFEHDRAEGRRPVWFDRLRTFVLALVCAAPLALSAAYAQSAPPPQTHNTTDGNGVDLVSGQIFIPSPAISIGQPGMGGLTYQRTYDSSIQDWRDNLTGAIDKDGATYTVTLMGAAEEFSESAGVFTSSEGRGGTLTFSAGANTYTYTTASGAVAIYDKDLASVQPTQADEGRITSLTLPLGEVTTFTYTELRTPALPTPPTFLAHRLQSVTNNLGYQIAFEYENDDADASGINLVEVTALNNGVDYCSPTANGCTFSQAWPTLAFGMDGTAQIITDSLSRTWRYAVSGSPQRITGIRWPGSGSDNITIGYNPSTGRVSSVSNGIGTWTYGFSVFGTTMTMGGSNPLSHGTVFVGNTETNRVTSYRDALGRTTTYQYDSLGRLTRTTRPEGNYTQYTYDARGNVTETRAVAKSGSGLSDIVTTATYPASCTGGGVTAATCNQPTSATDARSFRTDYTYDSTHGGSLTVTSPAPSGSAPIGSGVRPQTRYVYTQMYASYRQSGGGGVTQAPSAVYRLTEVSTCATTSSCDGGADETVTTVAYDTPDAFNNLMVSAVSAGAGNGSLTAASAVTYDAVGNMLTVDGPLAGANDTMRARYDGLRRSVGVVGPDPDAAGSLKHRAVRYTYNTQGGVTAIDQGTVNSQSDTDWNSFATLETLSVAYDLIGRRTHASFIAGGATHALTQYSYDNANRLECAAVRMNPAAFGSLPASACTLGTEGANGADRITRTTYDNNNRVTQVTNAYGTSAQRDTLTQSWTFNGLVSTLRDANFNLTAYEYDGFDRTRKIGFPNASGGGSSTTDYEQYTYDANSNITQDRRRDGATITFAYDNLNRATTMTPSAGAAHTYAYDNFSRMTQASFSGHALSFAYDQLSRNTSAGGPLGTVSYQYDLAGRRTRVTWPDSFYAQYDYDAVGAVTAIRENGASSGAGVLTTYAYNDLGRRTSVTRGNGVVTTYDFDAAGRLEALVQQLDGTSHDQTYTFAYNAADQATARTGSNAAYDWDQPAPSVANSTANGLNQIAALGGTNFTYDGRGNLTSTGSATYSYDVYNRLTGAGSATLAYDPAGRLHQTVGGGVTTRFLYDGVDMIAEYNAAGTQLLRRYVHGPGIDEPVVWYEGSGTSDRRWLLQDRLGSVIAVTDGSGAALSVNTYDEYGVPGSSNAGRFQYTGQMWIAEVGLYHYKARAYVPSLGRFLQSDPILYAGGMNLYAYVGNDPANWTDPSGNFAQVIAGAIYGGYTGAVSGFVSGGWRGAAIGLAVGGVVGGVVGAVNPGASGFATTIAIGALSSIAGDIAGEVSSGSPPTFDAGQYFMAGLGGYGGKVMGTGAVTLRQMGLKYADQDPAWWVAIGRGSIEGVTAGLFELGGTPGFWEGWVEVRTVSYGSYGAATVTLPDGTVVVLAGGTPTESTGSGTVASGSSSSSSSGYPAVSSSLCGRFPRCPGGT